LALLRIPKKATISWIVTISESSVKDDMMERAEKALKMPKKQFKRIIGTTKSVFPKMMNVLEVVYEKLHETGGKPPCFTMLN